MESRQAGYFGSWVAYQGGCRSPLHPTGAYLSGHALKLLVAATGHHLHSVFELVAGRIKALAGCLCAAG